MPHLEEQCLISLRTYSEGDQSRTEGAFPGDKWQPVSDARGVRATPATASDFSLVVSQAGGSSANAQDHVVLLPPLQRPRPEHVRDSG